LPIEELANRLLPFVRAAGYDPGGERMLKVSPLIQERITTLSDAASKFTFFFADELAPYDTAELIPQKGDAAMALTSLRRAREVFLTAEFNREALDAKLRAEADAAGIKPGQMFQPIRVAACGRKAAPPLFETLEVLGRETCIHRIDQAIRKLELQ